MAHTLDRPMDEIAFLTEFADWCRTKGDEAYDPTEADECAIAQFGMPGLTAREIRGLADGLWDEISHSAMPYEKGAFTFSALADRIDALIPARVMK